MEEVEQTRKRYAKKLIIFATPPLILLLIAAICAPLSFVIFFNGKTSPFNLVPLTGISLILLAISAIVSYFATRKDAKQYKNLYKSYFVARSLNEIFTEVKYDHNMGMPKEILKSTEMIRTGDIYTSNDYFSAKYHDVTLQQADVHIQEEHTDSDGNTSYVTIFKGRWATFEFPKKFEFRLQVVQKWFGANKKASRNSATGRTPQRITTESPTFNRKFKVFADDGFEAYYILDPAFIDHVEQLSNNQKGKIMLCFNDNKLHVAIYDKKDAFEPPRPLKAIDEAKEFSKVKNEIRAVTNFVDYLKLDRKLFTSSNK